MIDGIPAKLSSIEQRLKSAMQAIVVVLYGVLGIPKVGKVWR
jgi:hypothetical protein